MSVFGRKTEFVLSDVVEDVFDEVTVGVGHDGLCSADDLVGWEVELLHQNLDLSVFDVSLEINLVSKPIEIVVDLFVEDTNSFENIVGVEYALTLEVSGNNGVDHPGILGEGGVEDGEELASVDLAVFQGKFLGDGSLKFSFRLLITLQHVRFKPKMS